MTWELADTGMPTAAATPLSGQLPTRTEQLIGVARELWWQQNTWNSDQGYRNDLFDEMTRSIGGLEHFMPRTREETTEYKDPERRGYYLARRIGELKRNDPAGTYAHLPASPEEYDAMWKQQRQRDFDDNRAMLNRGENPWYQAAGGIVGAIADPVNLALAPLGGPVSGGLRFVLAEAALGAVSEIPGTLAEQERAGELGFTPQDPMTRIAGGAVGGAAIGGLMYGASRALSYGRTRWKGEADARPEARSGLDHQADIDTAETDLRMGREPRPAAPYRPDITLPAEQDPAVLNLTRMIGGLEAPKGGDQVYSGTVLRPPRPITTMTVNQVLDWQARSVAAGSKSSAAGRFQIIQDTLRNTRDAMGLTGNEVFDEAMQTRMAVHLMQGRGLDDWRAGRISTDQFMDNMAQEWAALPRATGPNAGRSHYDGDGLNQSLIGLDEARAIFGGQHVDSVAPRSVGSSSSRFTLPQARQMDWPDMVTAPGGTSVDVRYRVVDASELRAASGDLQPRDRSRAASDEQIAGIARDLDPQRLMPSPEGDRGAPVIGSDMMVESGNGRVAALNRAAEQHPERYQAYVRAIEEAGFEIPQGMTRPVLVAERVTDLDFEGRLRWVRENNTSAIARMSSSEQARLDAGYLTQHAFDGYQPGRSLNSVENTDFVRRIFAAMPQAERAGLMTAEGRLNIDGLRRLRQALFARAFDADDLLKLLAETEHPTVNNLLRMLEDLAPDWAAFRAMVDTGYVRPEFDITDQLMDVVRQIARARIDPREGQSVIAALRDRLTQGDMFTTRDPDLTEALIGAFYKGERARGPEASADILTRYMHEAETAGRADIDDMFAAEVGLTPTGVLREAVEAQDARAPMPARPDAAAEAAGGPAGGQIDIRAFDGIEAADGAQSPALTRAADAGLRELRDAPEEGPFGPIHHDYGGKPQDAIQRLLADRDGEAIGALSHRDVGEIDLVYGRAPDPATGQEGYGLAKIAAKHPEVLDDLQGFLDRLQMDPARSGPNRMRLSDESGLAVIRLDFEGNPKRWLLTAFEKRAGSGATTDTAATKALDDTAGQGTGARKNISTGSADRKAGRIGANAPYEVSIDRRLTDAESDQVDAWLEENIRSQSPLTPVEQKRLDRSFSENADSSPEMADLIQRSMVPAPTDIVVWRGDVTGRFDASGPVSFSLSQNTARNFGSGPRSGAANMRRVVIPAGTPVASPRSGISGGEILADASLLGPPARIADDGMAPAAAARTADAPAEPDEITQIIAGARAAHAADPEATIHITEGGVTRQVALADVLDELDRDEALFRSMTSCSLKGTPR